MQGRQGKAKVGKGTIYKVHKQWRGESIFGKEKKQQKNSIYKYNLVYL
jgi:hypothetical protein